MTKLLIVVDYQVDFVEGTLGFPLAKELDTRIAARIKQYREAGHEVIFTLDTHTSDYENTLEGENLPIPHCLKGSPGWELYGKVKEAVLPTDFMIEKPAFGSAALFDWIRTRCDRYESVELAGLVSNICVVSNAILVKTACPELPVVVDANLTACMDPDDHAAALRILRSVQVEVVGE